MSNRPILDPVPSGRPHDWQFGKIQMMKGVVELTFPSSWSNSFAQKTAPRDQDFRGTCVGQSTAHIFDLIYMMLTGDLTEGEKAQFKKNVTDQLGTIHDILYYPSGSAECAYQMSRFIGNVTYPAGSEIRFAVRAWKDYGMVREDQWHTDKKGTTVWMMPPGSRKTDDGGIDPEQCAEIAALHRIDGYAMCGTPDGGATWDEICYSIFTKGAVLGAIPVYENYGEMQGGDGTFPDPSGDISGYHALCFYGYDEQYLYLLHSWGDWCGRFGKISKNYFNSCQDQSVWMVVLDSIETKFGQDIHISCNITTNVPAMISVNGVNIGYSPQTIALEKETSYTLTATAEGYIAQTRTVDESTLDIMILLEPSPQPVKSWFQRFLDFLIALFKR
jgi:hypothetical protein